MGTFPFGRPVRACRPDAEGRRTLFILGAYPSALHVRWTAPDGIVGIKALPVDNEPMPFWDGADEFERIDGWKQAVGWSNADGMVAGIGRLNGSSGVWVRDKVLKPLGYARDDAWITDCLDTYRASTGVMKAVEDRFIPFAAARELPAPDLPSHPSESEIVAEASASHRRRLLEEIDTANPGVVITLGNAALRVLRSLIDEPSALPTKLDANAYGGRHRLAVAGSPRTVLPLAHPASPKRYQESHDRWVAETEAAR